jgi:hypothetical protein
MAELAISTSNVLLGLTPIVLDSGVGEIASNISDPDHSLNYTCGTATGIFLVDFGAQNNISYVAISGHTAATPANATVELWDNYNNAGEVKIDSVLLTRNNNVMFTFPSMNFTKLNVRFITAPSNFQMTVSFIAAGQYLAIETGQQAGYARNWLNRHVTQRSNSTLEVGPISSTQRAKALKGMLSLPNELAIFTEGTWQDFIDFSFEQPFFIKEFQDKPESSYICYDPMPGVKSHPQTPTLDVITLKFTVYNGL